MLTEELTLEEEKPTALTPFITPPVTEEDVNRKIEELRTLFFDYQNHNEKASLFLSFQP